MALIGVMFVWSAALLPAGPKAARVQRSKLERELAGYPTAAERRDLEAILDQYWTPAPTSYAASSPVKP